MAKEDLREFNARKTNRLSSVLMKLENLEDVAKMFKLKDAKTIATELLSNTNTHISRKSMSDSNGSTINVLTLKIAEQERESFISNVVDKYIEAGEMIIEKELANEKKDLNSAYIDDTIELISEDRREKYLNAIKSLSNLSKLKKVHCLNKEAFEIEKDLKACFNYEDKIALSKVQAHV